MHDGDAAPLQCRHEGRSIGGQRAIHAHLHVGSHQVARFPVNRAVKIGSEHADRDDGVDTQRDGDKEECEMAPRGRRLADRHAER